MDKMIAFCGINCSECQAYLATKANDQEMKEKVAASWRAEYNAPSITVESITCLGCQTENGPWCSHCGECDIRACGQEHKVQNCAYCDEFNSCARLTQFFTFAPNMKIVLEEIRQSI
jgi:hypothetical protein